MTSRLQDADDALQRKAEEWSNALIQLDHRNGMLNFKITKTTALDLGSSPEPQVAQLISGRQTRLGELFSGDEAYRDACTRTRSLVRKIRGFSEEQGTDVGRLVYGRVTSNEVKRGGARAAVALRAPLLLYQITVEARTAAENDFTLKADPEPELNPVLLYCLQHEYGIDINGVEFDGVLAEAEGSVRPDELVDKIFRRIAEIAEKQGVKLGFEPLTAIGICNYAKLPMVQDLRSASHLMAQHDLVALLAGCAPRGPDPRGEAPYIPARPDQIPSRDDSLVLDADSSQYRAIATALGDRHVVIDGPPGTGKSQTIANIIAAGSAAGLKILFVAEKRAAIEAVTDRLKEIELGALVLDLHQSSLSNRAVATQLSESFDKLSRVQAVDGDDLDRELDDSRRRLNEYAEALHTPHEPWALSAYQVREKIVSSAGGIETSIRLRSLKQFTPDACRSVEDDLRQFVTNGGLRLIRHESPWWQARVATEQDARDVLLRLEQVTAHTLRDGQASMRALVAQAGLLEPKDFQGWDRTLRLLSAISESARVLGPDIFHAPLNEFRVATAGRGARNGLQPKLGWRQRRYRLKELRQNPSGITQKPQLHAGVTKVLEEWNEWRQLGGAPSGPGRIGDLGLVSNQYDQLKTQLAAIAMTAGVEFAEQPLENIDRGLNVLAADRQMVPFLPDLNARLGRMRGAGLDPLLQEIAQRNADPEQAVLLFRHALMWSLDEEFMLTSQPLRDFQADSHNRVLERFRESDQRHLDLAVQRILRRVARGAMQARAEYPDESMLLQREGKKKRGHRPVRKLVAEAPHVMLAVRPCWAMSPLVVSRALPAEQLFDLVIFDEASQVQPHDAITSIMRGRRLVVAGDEKQLPPTSFFDRLESDDGESDADVELRDYESILTTLQPMVANHCRLQWHYRSQDERLIQFSNKEVYGGELVSFPGARVDTPVSLEVVDGRVLPGENGSADAEALRVVDLIIEHAETRPHESLGVITLGAAHQKKLDMAIRRAQEGRPDLNDFFADDRGPTKRFFIKNIETVQGDERDAIILSLGVAKNATGGVRRQGFAVLNQAGTERRVNVAVTRAKRRMTVVSSFPPGALSPSDRMTGTELLRRYLDAASRGGDTASVGRAVAAELNGFEQAIHDGMIGRGLAVVPQWGVSDYRIDFALPHPEEPGRMILAVEADGDSYHRTASARDRDRLRQQHLERLGWRFHRVWASAWFTEPERELDRIVTAFDEAVAACNEESAFEVVRMDRAIPVHTREIRPKLPRPDVRPGLTIDNYSHAQVTSMFRWRMSDGVLLDPEERMRQVREDLGFKRRGRKIDESLRKAWDEAQRWQDREEL
ncbi:AAA domain-containing protein [Nocardia alni]|uniref:AAA domain-containing protein n=1 Tax=Nocardia alni TaxID=2815723 RepID=UPI001C21C05A|nr:AAA domain-containing protein [Nocardia alni]